MQSEDETCRRLPSRPSMLLYSCTCSERSRLLADRSRPAGSIRANILSFMTCFPCMSMHTKKIEVLT